MYKEFYGLLEKPFSKTPDPRFLFLSKGHREALVHLRYGLTGRPGVTVLFGEAGTGKTTLVRAALEAVGGQNAMIVHLSNPTLTRQEFYEYIARSCESSNERSSCGRRTAAAFWRSSWTRRKACRTSCSKKSGC